MKIIIATLAAALAFTATGAQAQVAPFETTSQIDHVGALEELNATADWTTAEGINAISDRLTEIYPGVLN